MFARNERGSGPRDQRTKTLEEVGGRGGEKWGPGHCVRELPLYLFQSLVGLGLPCLWGPSCSVGSVTSAVVMVMDGPLSQGRPSPASPRQLPERIADLFPQGGDRMWAQHWTQDNSPSQSEPTAKCTFQTQAMTFLSKAPEKEWNLNIEKLFWP